jgi:chromosome partitioning protein
VRTLATYNVKGGVGKTSAAVNLAALAATSGLRTLLWDLDPQGAATFLLRVRAKVRGGGRKLIRGRSEVAGLLRGTDVEGLDLLPSDFSYRHMDLALDDTKRPRRRLRRVLAPVEEHYDLAVLDCQPSISLVSDSVFDAADVLVVPVIPSTLALRSYDQIVDHVAADVEQPPAIVPFFSMVDRRKALHRETVQQRRSAHPELGWVGVPAATEVERMGVHRSPVVVDAPGSRAAIAYRALWEEVAARLGLAAA